MTDSTTYIARRGQLENYFDRTASEAWAKLTSTAPVGRIRATVRAGRDDMRNTLMNWLPQDMTGQRLLDAGCGTGALAVEAALRGASVVATDLSPTLVNLARERSNSLLEEARRTGATVGEIDFRTTDMLDEAIGEVDWVVAMDSVIHYATDDVTTMVTRLAERARRGVLFTFAPRTPLLMAMWWAGQLFPRTDRSPAIVPQPVRALRRRLQQQPTLAGFDVGRSSRVSTTFYISQAQELVRR